MGFPNNSSPPRRELAPRLRGGLLIGVGVTVAIWLVAGYYFSRRIAELDRRSTDVSQRYLRAQERLADARGQTLVASVLVRDALLEADRSASRDYEAEILEAYAIAEAALRQYVPVLDSSAEQARIRDLLSQITELRESTLRVVRMGGPRPVSEAGRLLRTQIMPKREAVIGVADDLQTLNREAFVQHATEVTDLHAAAQRRVWQVVGLALLASLVVAILATRRAGQLEQRIQLQRAREIQDKETLQRLSARLVSAQEEERRTIARELHDEVGQVLTAIKVELAVAQKSIDAAGGPAEVLDDARAIAERAMHTVRDLSQLLHPPQLDDLGLPEAIEWFVKGFRKRHGIRVDLVHGPPVGSIPRAIGVAAYRIVQEALTNVAKHAQASQVHVEVGQGLDVLVVAVEDNGIGFDPGAVERAGTGGLGLVGVRERVERLNGVLRLISAPGQGTRLTVELPLGPPQAHAELVPATMSPALESSR